MANQPKILLGLTGSVATVLAPKIVAALQEIGEVKVVMTEAALRFTNPLELHKRNAVDVYTDVHEWSFASYNKIRSANHSENHAKHHDVEGIPSDERPIHWTETTDDWYTVGQSLWQKDQPILHIELRKWADAFVIAPLTKNTLAKLANGYCDNLLTGVYAAWDDLKPIVVAPAMNTLMWEKRLTQRHLNDIIKEMMGALTLVNPVEKTLACGDTGAGALANISDIAAATADALNWLFPLPYGTCSGIPHDYHPGSFSFDRNHGFHHTGVDLYTHEGNTARAVESGRVVSIAGFTGQKTDMKWWKDTDCVMVEGRSGVVNYGEINPRIGLKVGDKVRKGDIVGRVTPVVKEGRERPDVPGHSRSMLHFELYPHGFNEWKSWPMDQDEPFQMDPTELLVNAIGAPEKLPEYPGVFKSRKSSDK